MADISTGVLFGALVFLIFVSAFFSAAEIGLMTLNRYRLRGLADSGHRGARLAQKLLDEADAHAPAFAGAGLVLRPVQPAAPSELKRL